MKCELKLITRDAIEAIKFLPTWGGIAKIVKILVAETLVIIPVSVLAGTNAVFITVGIFISVCGVLVYLNVSNECKELRTQAKDDKKERNNYGT